MPLSRRSFLTSAAAGCVNLTAAASPPAIIQANRERNWQRIDERVNKTATPVDGNGYVDQPAFAIDKVFRGPQAPYDPQPGDIFFSITTHFRFKVGHAMVGAFQPSHSGIIFRRPDGSMALLEAGSFDVPVIAQKDLIPMLSAYRSRERVWIRRRSTPLSEEQSARLTCAAMKQDLKAFARLKLYNQCSPLRKRGPIRTEFLGVPRGIDLRGYYCAELVTELLVYIGAVNAADARPSATYPHDLFFDTSFNNFLDRHFKLGPLGWCPPSQWRTCLVQCGEGAVIEN